MREVGLRIAHPLHDGELARFPKRHQRLQRGMQARALVQLQHLLPAHGQPRSQAVVRAVGVRHNGIQAVVAAFELHQDKQIAIRTLCLRKTARSDQDAEGSSEEIAAVHLSW